MCLISPVCLAIMHAKFCADCNFLILVTEVVDKTVEQDTAQPENIPANRIN